VPEELVFQQRLRR